MHAHHACVHARPPYTQIIGACMLVGAMTLAYYIRCLRPLIGQGAGVNLEPCDSNKNNMH